MGFPLENGKREFPFPMLTSVVIVLYSEAYDVCLVQIISRKVTQDTG